MSPPLSRHDARLIVARMSYSHVTASCIVARMSYSHVTGSCSVHYAAEVTATHTHTYIHKCRGGLGTSLKVSDQRGPALGDERDGPLGFMSPLNRSDASKAA